MSTIKITWADTRAAQRRRPGSPVRVPLLLIPPYLLSSSSSSSARPVPFLLQRSRPDPGPGTPSGSSTRSPPTRSSRTSPRSPLSPRTIYNSLGIACKCKHRTRILVSIHRIVNWLGYDDSELTCLASEEILADEREIWFDKYSRKYTYNDFRARSISFR